MYLGCFLLFAAVLSFLPSRPKKLLTAQVVLSQGPQTLIIKKLVFKQRHRVLVFYIAALIYQTRMGCVCNFPAEVAHGLQPQPVVWSEAAKPDI